MRNTWRSAKTDSTWRLSSRASASDVPNGFSITTRTSAPARPWSPLLARGGARRDAKNSGAVDR